MLNNNTSSILYEGDGTTVDFPFPFKVWETSQLAVVISLADGGTEQDVTSVCKINLTDSGGTVTYSPAEGALPAGQKLAISRVMPFIQEDQYVTGTRFDPAEIEEAFDIACAERQELREKINRALLANITSGITGSQLVYDQLVNLSDAAANSASASASSAASAEECKQDACACAERAHTITDNLLGLSFSMHISDTSEGAVEYTPETGMVHFYVPAAEKGEQGLRGEQGIQGIQGPIGPQGIQGKIGERGPQGVQGVKGDVGPQGVQGVQGPVGETGAQGIQGAKGDKGDTGDKGEKGDIGPAGPQGPKGEAGDITTALDASFYQFLVDGPNLVLSYTAVPDAAYSINGNGELVVEF